MSGKAKGRGAIDQSAEALLLQLANEGSRLRRDEEGYRLHPRFAGGGTTAIREDLVRFCLKQDWMESRGGELLLSSAGRSWLKRKQANGDSFRSQHQLRATRLQEVEGARRPVLVNETESPLGWLRSRKDRNGRALISEDQFAAGEPLRADYWFAQLAPRVTANWSALAPSGRQRRSGPADAASLRDEVIAAKERVNRAIEAVGPELSGVLIDVCCELKGLEHAERNQGWPQRAGKVVLQLALTRLARHYGIGIAESGSAPRMRHWGSEDYRPTLGSWREEER
jgi:hypothetical protein